VIALEKNLIASADAHELVAEFGEARGWIAGAEKGEEGKAKERKGESSPRLRISGRIFVH
jgi:hypothetical protein